MSNKGKSTTANVIEWDDVDKLIKCAISNKQYTLASIIICGCYYGLKITDIRLLTWDDVLSDIFVAKLATSNRNLTIENTKGAKDYFLELYRLSKCPNRNDSICKNRYGGVISSQCVNRQLKELKIQAKLFYLTNFSTESFRKTFGKHIYDLLPLEAKESGLEMLCEYFSQRSTQETKMYIGCEKTVKFKSPFELMTYAHNNAYIIDDSLKRNSYVYIMRDSNLPDYYKIGKANNVKKREKTLQGEKPTIDLYKYIQLDNEKVAYAVEAKLHQEYKDKRVRGEWFKLNNVEVESILNKYNWLDADFNHEENR